MPRSGAAILRLVATDDHSTPVAGVEVDAEVSRLLTMQQQVQCDVYHMKAYVRFRKVVDGSVEHYIAWHQPDHPILPLAAPFFCGTVCFSALVDPHAGGVGPLGWGDHQLRPGSDAAGGAERRCVGDGLANLLRGDV